MGEARFPSGDERAIGGITLSVDELRARLAIDFFEDVDDLDYFTAGWLISRVIGPVLLTRYPRSPDPHVEVRVDSKVSRDAAILALASEFGLGAGEWIWTTKHQTYAESLAEAERLTREAMEQRPTG